MPARFCEPSALPGLYWVYLPLAVILPRTAPVARFCPAKRITVSRERLLLASDTRKPPARGTVLVKVCAIVALASQANSRYQEIARHELRFPTGGPLTPGRLFHVKHF